MITDKDVKHIAALARIHLREEEIPGLTKNLEDILGYVDKLTELDVSQVEPTSHITPVKDVFREDIVKPSLDQKAVLDMAVESAKGAFKVPKVIE